MVSPGAPGIGFVFEIAGDAGRAPTGELVCAMWKGEVNGQSAFCDAFVPGKIERLVSVKLATGRQFWATNAETLPNPGARPLAAVATAGDHATVKAQTQADTTTIPARIQGAPSLSAPPTAVPGAKMRRRSDSEGVRGFQRWNGVGFID